VSGERSGPNSGTVSVDRFPGGRRGSADRGDRGSNQAPASHRAAEPARSHAPIRGTSQGVTPETRQGRGRKEGSRIGESGTSGKRLGDVSRETSAATSWSLRIASTDWTPSGNPEVPVFVVTDEDVAHRVRDKKGPAGGGSGAVPVAGRGIGASVLEHRRRGGQADARSAEEEILAW
jgi:hypothetical protein